ncbi:MAG TPA: hypothetical protein VGB62_06180 [Allosphingosinicella sp.]|jgi:hypothetical protein
MTRLATPLYALLIAAAVAAFLFWTAAPVTDGRLLASLNWAFDYDPLLYVDRWCRAGGLAIDGSDHLVWGRHPAALVVRPLCLGLTDLGLDPRAAAMLLAAAFSGLCAGAVFLFARTLRLHSADSALAALAFAVTAQPLFLGAIPESFGLAMLGIIGHFCLLARWSERPFPPRAATALSTVSNFGITLTNGMLVILSWIATSAGRVSPKLWLRETTRTGLISAALLLAPILAVTIAYTPGVFADPLRSVREFWWGVNIDNGAPAPFLTVFATFALYDYVAPGFTSLGIEGGAKTMLDFRAFSYGPLGLAAAAAWAALLALGIASALQDARRRLWLVCALWFGFNLLLHWHWQYRGSVYLYGAHPHFALFALAIAALRPELAAWRRRLGRGLMLAFLLLAGASNLGLYFRFIEAFTA